MLYGMHLISDIRTNDIVAESNFPERFADALGGNAGALRQLAFELKRQGQSQSQVYDLYRHQLRKHLGAADEAAYAKISDAMDEVAGHCEKARWIFAGRL
jgi:hypothetical protein